MKKCPNCGALMEGDVNFCTECGQDLHTVAVEVKQQEPISVEQAPEQVKVV